MVVLDDEVLSFRAERTGMISSWARGSVRGFSALVLEVEEEVDDEGSYAGDASSVRAGGLESVAETAVSRRRALEGL